MGFTWFEHQADWQLASEGWTLLTSAPQPGDNYTDIQVADPLDTTYVLEDRHQRTKIVPRVIIPRVVNDYVGPAHHCANLAAYKAGKSYGGAAWLVGFGILPEGNVQLIGLEYSTSEPEFNYLLEFLCSERGLNMKAKIVNDLRSGRMSISLETGCLFSVKSWNQKEALKGKKVDAYYYAEAYQLPGMICYTSISQNLRQNRGYAAWTTTPDEPWVASLHDKGHGEDADWHCNCGAKDIANPYTYDQKARDRDDPDKGGIMTRERFAIAHDGTLGTFVGRVYGYKRGDRMISPDVFPQMYRDEYRHSA